MAKVNRKRVDTLDRRQCILELDSDIPSSFDATTLTQTIPVRFRKGESSTELGDVVILHYKGAALPLLSMSPFLRVYGINPNDNSLPLYPTKIQVRSLDGRTIAEYTQPPYKPSN